MDVRFSSSPQPSYRSWGPRRVLSNGLWRPQNKAVNSPICSAEVKNAWNSFQLLHHTSAGCVYLNTNTDLPSGQDVAAGSSKHINEYFDHLSGYELLSEGTNVKLY